MTLRRPRPEALSCADPAAAALGVKREPVSELSDLERRVGGRLLRRRLRLQRELAARFRGKGLSRFHPENTDLLPTLLRPLLTSFGLLGRGERNAGRLELVEHEALVDDLPVPFEGFRFLQLSDVHIDGSPALTERLCAAVQGLRFDLCALTGDFRFRTHGDYRAAVQAMTRLAESLRCPHGVFGILGNHDPIEMVPGLESAGIRMLLNEAVVIRRGEDEIHVVGLDDTHFYRTHDLRRAMAGIPPRAVKLLLAHSPEIIPEAAAAGVQQYFCGHTHGGQICLPGGIPLVTRSRGGRAYAAGPWRYGRMGGYTSRGAGTSGLNVRYCCPPEITVHHLRRSTDGGAATGAPPSRCDRDFIIHAGVL